MLISKMVYTVYRLHKLLQVWSSANLTADDHPFVILLSVKICCSNTASNIFSHPPRRQRCNTLHFASKEVCQTFPLDSLKRVYICNYSAVIYSFSNHLIGIEPCDDYISKYKLSLVVYFDILPQKRQKATHRKCVAFSCCCYTSYL